jgi:hypothetical protein
LLKRQTAEFKLISKVIGLQDSINDLLLMSNQQRSQSNDPKFMMDLNQITGFLRVNLTGSTQLGMPGFIRHESRTSPRLTSDSRHQDFDVSKLQAQIDSCLVHECLLCGNFPLEMLDAARHKAKVIEKAPRKAF